MKRNTICFFCGEVLTEETAVHFNGKMMCSDCFDQNTTVCDCCGERIWSEESHGDNHVILCGYCYENEYSSCEDCGRLIANENTYYDEENDYPYCHECFQKLKEGPIKSYNYKPDPMFFGSGNLFMGVELEVDKAGEDNEYARMLLEVANQSEERIYCKHDGSLQDGFELVSHPMTLDYHIGEMNWKDIFFRAVNMGYRSHQTSTCGLHIHVNRSAFGESAEEQEESIGRIVFFVEKHWNELVKFSRRTSENLNRWAAKYATISDTTQETYKKAKDKRMGRYVAVNLDNYSTIEFRLFRGTLCYNTFLATLQLVERICKCAMHLTDSEIESMTWGDFVLNMNKETFPELIEYLKLKRLYVNEVTEEEE